MSPADGDRLFSRVTAVLDGGGKAGDLLRVATELAARLHADVQAVQMEDANLLRLSELGIARMVSLFDAAGPLLPREAAAAFGRLAAEAEAALRSAARTFGLAWSFRVLQGDLAEAVGPNELLVVHLPHQALAADQRFVASIWAATEARTSGIMLIGRQPAHLAPAVLVTGRSAADQHALQLAAALLRSDTAHLDVLLAAPESEAGPTEQWAREQLRARGRRAHVVQLRDCTADSVTEAARHSRRGLLVMPADAPCLGAPGELTELLEQAECALLLLR